jgi:hypothetical protein
LIIPLNFGVCAPKASGKLKVLSGRKVPPGGFAFLVILAQQIKTKTADTPIKNQIEGQNNDSCFHFYKSPQFSRKIFHNGASTGKIPLIFNPSHHLATKNHPE